MTWFSDIDRGVAWMMGAILGLLVIASVVLRTLAAARPNLDLGQLKSRVRSWWIMAGVFGFALSVSRNVTLVFFAFVSFIAMKEFLSLIPTRRADRRVLFWVYLTIPIQYYWVGIGWYGMFIIFIPVYIFLLLPMRMVLIGETRDFLRAAGTLHWCIMTTVFSVSHVAFLLILPESSGADWSGAGMVLYLVFLTQANDVSQYLWGRSLGRRKVLPKVSPNKTWAGLLGGVLTTTILAGLLAPLLTPLSRLDALVAGGLIGLSGFIGDVTISAIKRDMGIKDSGTIIPGHGGILDRIDSLTYTAPLFFHYFRYLY